jgi:hypothetical protein
LHGCIGSPGKFPLDEHLGAPTGEGTTNGLGDEHRCNVNMKDSEQVKATVKRCLTRDPKVAGCLAKQTKGRWITIALLADLFYTVIFVISVYFSHITLKEYDNLEALLESIA